MPLNEAALDRLIDEALWDCYERHCRDLHAKYPNGEIPKAEKRALDSLYIDAVNETPEQLAVTLAANKEGRQSEAERKLLYSVKPITEAPGWDGRRAA